MLSTHFWCQKHKEDYLHTQLLLFVKLSHNTHFPKWQNHVGVGPSQGSAQKNTFKETSIPTTKQKGGLAKQLFENNKNCLLACLLKERVTLVESEA
jgi:hypothetical protein